MSVHDMVACPAEKEGEGHCEEDCTVCTSDNRGVEIRLLARFVLVHVE